MEIRVGVSLVWREEWLPLEGCIVCEDPCCYRSLKREANEHTHLLSDFVQP